MANNFSANMPLWILDTAGVFYSKPVIIRKILLYPNAAGDAATFYSFDPSATAKSTASEATTTVSGNTTIASTGAFTATKVAVGDAIVIKWTSTGNNIGAFMVKTRTDDNTIVVCSIESTTAPLTNESSKKYSWSIQPGYISVPVLSPGTEKCETEIDFGDGLWVPNLGLISLSTSAKVYIYLK